MNSSPKTPTEQCEKWIVEVLQKHGGQAWLQNIISELERTKPLTDDDRQLQRGHEHESRFSYRCRWAVTNLRKQGILKNKSPRGMIEMAEGDPPPKNYRMSMPRQELSSPSLPANVWIFQATPKKYRILEAIQELDLLNFYVSRYAQEMAPGDVTLLWVTGNNSGIYAQGEIVEGVALRPDEGSGKTFWLDPNESKEVRPRVVIRIERRFLANPLLRSEIKELPELSDLQILLQPQGSNFRVTLKQWEVLQRLLPEEETLVPQEQQPMHLKHQTRGKKIYEKSCGQILERYVREHFRPGEEHPRNEIVNWFLTNYPLFKKITVLCHIEQYTTNYRSRVHYNARPENDLLFRVADDWDRVRLYEPETDPRPIYKIESSEKRQKKPKGTRVPLIDRHRLLLQHLATFGELTFSEEQALGVTPGDISAWLDSLLVVRPGGTVVSPLFLWAAEGNSTPNHVATRLAIMMLGDFVQSVIDQPVDSLEEYVWEHFGTWRLPQPHPGDAKWHGYLTLPCTDAADRLPSERLDLFANLPATVISDLVRNTGFLSEQQKWSAQAAGKGNLGTLSRQMKLGVRRPLLLSLLQLPSIDNELELQNLPKSDIIRRHYVIAGVPLCTAEERAKGEKLSRGEVIDRLLDHPLYALMVQFEVYRLMASISGEPAANLLLEQEERCRLEFEDKQIPLWQACRSLLVDLGFWPVTWSANDSYWEKAVQQALINLENLLVLERIGDRLCLTEAFSSEIKAHPGCHQNRGEKEFRIRLGKYLESLRVGLS